MRSPLCRLVESASERPGAASWRFTFAFLAVATSWLITACVSPPAGPAFEFAAPPPTQRARLYVYRADARSSLSRIKLTLDGREIGMFRDAEYETLEIPAGAHRLRAGLRSLGGLAWGWNEHPLLAKPGETIFVELSVRLTPHATPGARELEIAGRASGGASENVYIQRRPEKEAKGRIATTTRLVP